MASSSSSSTNNIHHIRSISLPTRSHHATLQVEEELCNLKTWEAATSSIATAETFCSGLDGLQRLFECVNDLLSLPLTQQALSSNKYQKLVDELLDRSIMLVDVCSSTSDAISQVKEHVKDVQSAQRRGRGELTIDNSFIRKLKKDTKRAVSALKQIDNKISGTALPDLDHHLSEVIRLLRDSSAVSISVFGSLISFVSMSVLKPKSTRWSVVSKLTHKRTTESKDQSQISIDGLESHIEGIESGLESMCRSLIKTRASLLNIRSH